MNNDCTLIFDGWKFDRATNCLQLQYSTDSNFQFSEIIDFSGCVPSNAERVSDEILEPAFDCLYLASGVSYLKAVLPSSLVLKSVSLNEEQAEFWTRFYREGLAEFCYTNNIMVGNVPAFPVCSEGIGRGFQGEFLKSSRTPVKTLLPVGGGKDSLLSALLLLEAGQPFTLFCVNPTKHHRRWAKKFEQPLLEVSRKLSPELLRLSELGAVKTGHVPITGINSCISVLACLFSGHDSIAMSLERTADEPQAFIEGKGVNHQWSKSSAFETSFAAYISKYVTNTVIYFSLLRPFSEYSIVELLANRIKNPAVVEALKASISCNRLFPIDQTRALATWCGECPKCAFVFALYACHLGVEFTSSLFGKNLLEEQGMLTTYRTLCGFEKQRPFECVGSAEELKLALYELSANSGHIGVVLRDISKELLASEQDWDAIRKGIRQVKTWDLIPQKLRAVKGEGV